jgi:hypothetical protein
MATCDNCNSQNIKVITAYNYHDIFECQNCNHWKIQKIDSCCRNPFELLVFKYNNSIPIAIYVQCNNCGGSLTMTKPLSFKDNSKSVRGEFSQVRYNDWKSEKQYEADQIYGISRQLRFINSSYYKYIQYLQSEEWKSKRLLVLERDNWICQSCKILKADEVHHLTYANLGNENLDDLISYCKKCHLSKHLNLAI